MVRYAQCCSPIPGDAIVGFLSKGQGIVIHRESCRNVYKNPSKFEDRIAVQWEALVEGEFQVSLRIGLQNKPGTLAELAALISQAGSNIDNITTEEKDGYYIYFLMVIGVTDRLHLARILRKIRALKSVIRIGRK